MAAVAHLVAPNDDEAILRLESFIAKYPEIDRVSYYRDDGSVMFSITNSTEEIVDQVPIMGGMLTDLSFLVGAEAPYMVETSILNARAFERHVRRAARRFADAKHGKS